MKQFAKYSDLNSVIADASGAFSAVANGMVIEVRPGKGDFWVFQTFGPYANYAESIGSQVQDVYAGVDVSELRSLLNYANAKAGAQ